MKSIAELSKQQDISELVSSLDTVPKDSQNSTLGSVLSKVSSSHSAVYIYDDNDEFMGLVSPYKTLYSGNYPYSTSVETILFRPPEITRQTSAYDAARHMLATKLYSLPVFEDGKPIGVIHSDSILRYVADTPELLGAVSEDVTPRNPVIASINSSVGEVYSLLRDQDVSRIILVNDTGVLAGIVTRSDLLQALIRPAVRRRFAPEGSDFGFYSRAGEKKFRTDASVREHAVTMADTLPADTKKSKLVTHLINSPHRSVVLVDSKRRPSGFLSIRDLLQALSPAVAGEAALLKVSISEVDIQASDLAEAEEYLQQFSSKLAQRMAAETIAVSVDGRKNTKGQTKAFDITLKAIPVAGEPIIASVEAWKLLDGVQSAAALIEKQRRRSGLSALETRQTQ